MISNTRRLSPAEIAEANALGDEVGRCRKLLDTSREQLTAASKGGVDQDSDRWGVLCDAVAERVEGHNKASVAERGWWQSKGFNV